MDKARTLGILTLVGGLTVMGPAMTTHAAENLTSFEPDMVFDCLLSGKPSNACQLSCPDQSWPSGGHFGHVARVEIFTNRAAMANTGRQMMVLKTYPSGPSNSPKAVLSFVYLGSDDLCLFSGEDERNSAGTLGLRLTKFGN